MEINNLTFQIFTNEISAAHWLFINNATNNRKKCFYSDNQNIQIELNVDYYKNQNFKKYVLNYQRCAS